MRLSRSGRFATALALMVSTGFPINSANAGGGGCDALPLRNAQDLRAWRRCMEGLVTSNTIYDLDLDARIVELETQLADLQADNNALWDAVAECDTRVTLIENQAWIHFDVVQVTGDLNTSLRARDVYEVTVTSSAPVILDHLPFSLSAELPPSGVSEFYVGLADNYGQIGSDVLLTGLGGATFEASGDMETFGYVVMNTATFYVTVDVDGVYAGDPDVAYVLLGLEPDSTSFMDYRSAEYIPWWRISATTSRFQGAPITVYTAP